MNEEQERDKLIDEIIAEAEKKYLLLSNDISDEELEASTIEELKEKLDRIKRFEPSEEPSENGIYFFEDSGFEEYSE
ncbi:hypothetical protein [Intestinibacter sp.]|uniref:hypothetical protein n=1 Tax=Intestinibacter sp. TaxID=1965304 RepID=UPI002A7549E7|nr:hypothetical protein [Intestinibacter sp.]MDY2736531.1 hypothetical protein [Intestinibacter sp.]